MRKLLAVVFGLTLVFGGAAAFASQDNVKAGEKIFNKCKACHSLEPGKKKVGPSLYGIVGKKAASAESYKYSKAMKNANITWDEESLDAFLANPRKFVKGTKMSFPGLKKEADRENVIAYIKAKSK